MLFLFYFFSLLSLISGLFVILSKNPVHSVLFLILVFCSSAGLLLLLDIEFLAMIFLVVYVGAIAVLFLFVVMMLNIKILEITEGFFKYLPISFFVGIIFLIEILLIIKKLGFNDLLYNNYVLFDFYLFYKIVNNIQLLGELLYFDYFLLFLISSVILLVAMIGSIILTLNQKLIIKRQNIYTQLARNVNSAIKLKDIK